MTVVEAFHEDLGATFTERGGVRVPDHYGRPERTHHAVRKVVGLIEMPYGVLTVSGDDRVEFVDNVVTNAVPTEDGRGCYALILNPKGRIETELYVYNAGERLLVFTTPERAGPLAEEWREHVFIQDVEVERATERFGVFGVHGPKATEKVASVLNHAGAPDEPLSFVRGQMGDAGVTVVRTDAPTGEEGYEVVCAADDAHGVFDTLLNHGLNAAPFGHRTWDALALEAGTPLFRSELAGRIPNVVGVRNALDFAKGCYVGQEVVSRIENLGKQNEMLVGLTPEALPEPGAAVFQADSAVGEVTRAVESPMLERPIALAIVGAGAAEDVDLTVRVGGEEVSAIVAELPFVEGSERSARLPTYE